MSMMQKCKYIVNNDSQLRIIFPKCVAILQNLRITFRFFNPALCVGITFSQVHEFLLGPQCIVIG